MNRTLPIGSNEMAAADGLEHVAANVRPMFGLATVL
jgi:hypothetical protein